MCVCVNFEVTIPSVCFNLKVTILSHVQLHYLKSMKWRIYKHLKVLRKGGTQRRYWYRWYRWSYTWYNRYRASWRAWKKRSASRKRRRVWRYKVCGLFVWSAICQLLFLRVSFSHGTTPRWLPRLK